MTPLANSNPKFRWSSSSSSSRSRSPYNKHQRERSRSAGRSKPGASRSSRRSPSPKRRRSDAGRSTSYRRSSPSRRSRSRSRSPRRRSDVRRSPPRRSSPRRSPPRRSSPRRSPLRRSSPRRSSPRRSSPRRSSLRHSPPRRSRTPPRKRSPSPYGSSKRYPKRSPSPRQSGDHRSRSISPVRGRSGSSRDRSATIREAQSTSSRDYPKRRDSSDGGRLPSYKIDELREREEREEKLKLEQRQRREEREKREEQEARAERELKERALRIEQARREEKARHEERSRREEKARHEERERHESRDNKDRDERIPRDLGYPRSRSRSPVPRHRSPVHESRDQDWRKPPHPLPRDHMEMEKPRDKHRDEDLRQRKYSPERYHQESPHKKDPSPRSLGQTSTSLNDRFGTGRHDPFTPDENITVGIERNIPGDEEPIIQRALNPDNIVLVRRSEEGETPLYLREEFKGPKEDEYTERRVVRVVRPEGDSVRRYEQQYQRENFEVRRDKFESRIEEPLEPSKPSLHERWGRSDERKIEPTYSKRDKDKVEVVRRESRKHEQSKGHSRSEKGESSKDIRNFEVNRSSRDGDRVDRQQKVLRVYGDKDERVISERRFMAGGMIKVGDFRRDEDMRPERQDRFEKDPRDLRHNLAKRRSSGAGSREDQFDARQKILEKRREEERRKSGDGERRDSRRGDRSGERGDSRKVRAAELPDFSKRADKGVFDEWKEKPEMVPKGISYFEHDNRGDINYWERRGRGGFRGRGRGFRGRGTGDYRKSSYGGGDWKHDKFKEMEDDQDNKPTSTTK